MDIKIKKTIDALTGRADEDAANEKELRKSRWNYLLELAKVAAVSALIVIPIRYFLIQPFVVCGQSMEPNFYGGEKGQTCEAKKGDYKDYLIIDEFTYRHEAPKRGDVVVFRFPRDTSQFFIKRIIGLPGETIEVKNGKVEIYNSENPWGFVLKEPYLKEGEFTRKDISMKIEPDNFFVMGDNRQESYDSRDWKTVDKKYIIGKIWLRAWPLNRAQAFSEQITY